MSLMGNDPFLMGSRAVGREPTTSSISLSNPFCLSIVWIVYPIFVNQNAFVFSSAHIELKSAALQHLEEVAIGVCVFHMYKVAMFSFLGSVKWEVCWLG
jgi:hypothetical protein